MIDLSDHVDALKPSAVAFSLHGCNFGTILHVTVQLLTSKTGFREFEQQRDQRDKQANVRNGTCKWADPIYETTRLLQDSKSKQCDEKLYKLVVAMFMRRTLSLDSLLFDPEIEKAAKALRKARREELREMAENRENDRNHLPPAIPIRDHFRPVLTTHYSGIARGTINANNFELKPALINMVQQNQFSGAATADPHMHIRTFLEITDTVKINNVSDDIIRLRLFPFSLRDQERSWLQSLPLGSIITWEDLATKFLAKYFHPAKSAQMKIAISTFRQTDLEQLYEAWERYKEMLRRCPNHGFEDWVQIELFYNGLNGQTRTTVDAAAGGTIFANSPAQAYDLLEEMTINSYQ